MMALRLSRVMASMVTMVAWLVSMVVIPIVSTEPVHVHCGGAVGGVNLGHVSVKLLILQRISERKIISFQIKVGFDV